MSHVPDDTNRAAECLRADLAGDLVRWDELPFRRRVELESHARACPSCGPALALLRRADAWLNAQSAPSACPAAEELYDFGAGPGAGALASERRDAVERHVRACAECRAFVATLASRPPAPLVLDASGPDAAGARPATAARGPRARRAWVSLAAAALALLAFGLWWRQTGAGERPAQGPFPADELLRGHDAGALRFPRGAVLALEGRAWNDVVFELEPRERATRYRFVLLARDDGALGPGRELARWDGAEPTSTRAAVEFAPGRYTWEAWAEVDGLDVPLGRRDFHVTADAETAAALQRALALSGDARVRAVLELLHGGGYLGDARAFARTLPQSPERDAYLARTPGR